MFFSNCIPLIYNTFKHLGAGLGLSAQLKEDWSWNMRSHLQEGYKGISTRLFSKSNFRVLWPSLVAILWEASHTAAAATGPVGPGALGEGRWHPQIMTEIYSSYLWFSLKVRSLHKEIVLSSILKKNVSLIYALASKRWLNQKIRVLYWTN